MRMTDREKRILYLLVQGMTKAELIDAIASSSKLTKADAGRMMGSMPLKEFEEFLLGKEKAVIIDAISAGAKLTKADAGRALDAAIEAIHKKLKVVFGGRGQRKLKTVFGGKGQIAK
jgi:nucleoid DNA-binding protein